MSLAATRVAMKQPMPPAAGARPWILAGLLPLVAFVAVPLLAGVLVPTVGAGLWGTSVPWNATMFVLATTLVIATVTDLSHRRIRNHLTYTAFLWIVGFSVLASWSGAAVADPASATWLQRSLVGTLDPAATLAGAAVCFGLMFVVFMMAGAGGGDVKICTVIGAALGVELGFTAMVVSHIVAGAAALVWLVVRYGPVSTFGTLGRGIGSLLLPLWILPPKREAAAMLKFPLPMSPFFLVGTVLTLFLIR